MKILLTALNAKYIHMNPALYSIRAYAGEYGAFMEIAEYTINQDMEGVLMDILERDPDVIGFSCYIWNIRYIESLVERLAKILPDAKVFLGGPEVSYNSDEVMRRFESVDGVFCGEGEKSWKEAARQFVLYGNLLYPIAGLHLRDDDPSAAHALHFQGTEQYMDLDEISFPYEDLSPFEHRMIYYETSRGCPFRCSYCLSSIDKRLRLRSLEKVLPELQFFLDHKVRIVKFIDRTFNASHEHAMSIWKYLADHDNGITRFHFEIEADLVTDEDTEFLKSVRPGLFQLEIGVQTTNPQTLKEIRRYADIDKIRHVVTSLKGTSSIRDAASHRSSFKETENVEGMPVHVDLIAGLPFEDMESFKRSFNEVYSWRADELQLGFLKVLHGTEMELRADAYSLEYDDAAPYEVISTKWMSSDDILHLKEVEEQLDRYGNSGAYEHTLTAFERLFDTPFEMFESIAEYYRVHRADFRRESRISAFEMLRSCIGQRLGEISGQQILLKHFDALLLMDLYEKEKLKKRPEFFGDASIQKQRQLAFLRSEMSPVRSGQTAHVEFFDHDVQKFERTGLLIPVSCAVIFVYEGQGRAVQVLVKNIEK